MGCNCSNLGGTGVIAGNSKKRANYMAELASSCEAASRFMPELRSFHTLPTLKKIVLNNQTLLFLSTEHLKIAVSTMNILASVKLALARARNRQAIILQALDCYEKEQHKSFRNYSKTLSKLREFKEAGDPFAVLLNGKFASLCENQRSIVQELKSKKEELRVKTCSTKRWKKVWKVMSNAVFVSLLILSVVLAAIAAPPLAAVAVAAGGTAIKTVEQWVDSVWTDRVAALDGEKEIVLMMMKGEVGGHEMESVRAMVRRLEIRIGSIKGDAVFAVERGKEEEVAVEMAAEEVKGKVGMVEEWIEGLEMKVEACEGEVKKVVGQFFDVITNDL